MDSLLKNSYFPWIIYFIQDARDTSRYQVRTELEGFLVGSYTSKQECQQIIAALHEDLLSLQ